MSERLLNSGTDVPLNRWFKKQKTEKSTDTDVTATENDESKEKEEDEDEEETFPSSFPKGLRPSVEFMAFKLRQQQAQEN